MNHWETKTIDAGTLDVDTSGRQVKVAVSKMGNLDLDNDVIAKGAFTKTIKERGPDGAKLIWHLTDHRASLTNALGKPKQVYVEGEYLIFVTDIRETTLGNDILKLYQAGDINQHSIGFRTIKWENGGVGTPKEHRIIKEVMLYEGSAVPWGANPETPTLSGFKSLTPEQKEKEFLQIQKELSNLAKLFKIGDLSDETYVFAEMKIAQLNEKIGLLSTASPVSEDTVKSNDESVLNALKSFNNSLTVSQWMNSNKNLLS